MANASSSGGGKGVVNRQFVVYVIQSLLRIYTFLWKFCDGVGLDITT
jgi:hypothetical protein